jgi:hypothetical protein
LTVFFSGTKSTADAEAREITSFVSSSAARDEANKDVAVTEKLQQLASKARTTQLSMAGGEFAWVCARWRWCVA